ncbi:MAG: hypothetical protein LBJ57_07785 [Prevotellaceae bacterium]|nr:hypothetical protein [Prevotellaceae bacterium]
MVALSAPEHSASGIRAESTRDKRHAPLLTYMLIMKKTTSSCLLSDKIYIFASAVIQDK